MLDTLWSVQAAEKHPKADTRESPHGPLACIKELHQESGILVGSFWWLSFIHSFMAVIHVIHSWLPFSHSFWWLSGILVGSPAVVEDLHELRSSSLRRLVGRIRSCWHSSAKNPISRTCGEPKRHGVNSNLPATATEAYSFSCRNAILDACPYLCLLLNIRTDLLAFSENTASGCGFE